MRRATNGEEESPDAPSTVFLSSHKLTIGSTLVEHAEDTAIDFVTIVPPALSVSTVHTTCVSAMDKIQHTILHDSHNHPMIVLERPAVFFYFACGTEHGDASYLCPACGFWMLELLKFWLI
ncbi:hypothetical protein U1Q18_016990 [Sarracenia purpurea var. burkii]